jgi:hypothetical protein
MSVQDRVADREDYNREQREQYAARRKSRRSAPREVSKTKKAWRVPEWSDDVGCGQTKTNELIRDKRVESVLLDGRRLILTPPEVFLAGLSKQQNG